MANKKFLLGTLVLAFGLIMAGCEHRAADPVDEDLTSFDGKEVDAAGVVEEGKSVPIKAVLMTDDGKEVLGFFDDIGTITRPKSEETDAGTITPSATFKMALPENVNEGKLVDFDLDSSPLVPDQVAANLEVDQEGVKCGILSLTAGKHSLDLEPETSASGPSEVFIVYFNKDFSISQKTGGDPVIAFKHGWNYVSLAAPYALTSLSGCKWTLTSSSGTGPQ
jgi:hypothetical protein